MITLDNDGFTLSPLVELGCNSWKGRKDRATVLKNRLFVASFSRLSLNFDACKNIRDFRSYWNLVAEDYPCRNQCLLRLLWIPDQMRKRLRY